MALACFSWNLHTPPKVQNIYLSSALSVCLFPKLPWRSVGFQLSCWRAPACQCIQLTLGTAFPAWTWGLPRSCWTWLWPADSLPGLTSDLLHHRELAWWFQLLFKPGYYLWAFPAQGGPCLTRPLPCWPRLHSTKGLSGPCWPLMKTVKMVNAWCWELSI